MSSWALAYFLAPKDTPGTSCVISCIVGCCWALPPTSVLTRNRPRWEGLNPGSWETLQMGSSCFSSSLGYPSPSLNEAHASPVQTGAKLDFLASESASSLDYPLPTGTLTPSRRATRCHGCALLLCVCSTGIVVLFPVRSAVSLAVEAASVLWFSLLCFIQHCSKLGVTMDSKHRTCCASLNCSRSVVLRARGTCIVRLLRRAPTHRHSLQAPSPSLPSLSRSPTLPRTGDRRREDDVVQMSHPWRRF